MRPDDPRHGEERGYFAHRKAGQQPCAPCTVAHRAAQKRRTLRAMQGDPAWLPVLGSRRRLQALHRLGWSTARIADEAGRSREQMRDILTRHRYVTASVAQMVTEVYDRLSMTLPTGPRVNDTRQRAEAAGWLPPLAWTDIDTDPEPTRAPKPNGRPEVLFSVLEDFDWLTSAGESPEKAAARVGVALATIRDYRLRAARREMERAS